MRMIFSKTWHAGGRPSGIGQHYLTVGLSLNQWALPLHFEARQPYTTLDPDNDDERRVTQVVFEVLCFYVEVEW
jgi:hypothetical protein